MFGIKLPSNIIFTSDSAFLLLWCYVNIHSQLAIFPSSKKVHSIRGDVVWTYPQWLLVWIVRISLAWMTFQDLLTDTQIPAKVKKFCSQTKSKYLKVWQSSTNNVS